MMKSGRNKENEVSPEMLQVLYKLDFQLKNREWVGGKTRNATSVF